MEIEMVLEITLEQARKIAAHIDAVVDASVAAEREECAKIADDSPLDDANYIAASIRSRSALPKNPDPV